MSRQCAFALVTLAFATLAAAALPRAAFAANVRANDLLDNPAYSTNSGAAIAMDGMRVVVAWTEGQGATGYAYSSNGGLTFTDGGTLLENYPTGYEAGDPTLTTDHAGSFFVASKMVIFYGESSAQGLDLRRGSFTGGTFAWNDPVTVVSSGDDSFSEPSLALDPVNGTLYMSWTRWLGYGGSGSRIEFTRSTDQGATWSSPIVLATTSFPINPYVQSSRVAVGPDQSVVVLFVRHQYWVGPSTLHSRRSTTAGVSFDAEATIPTPYGGALLNLGSGPPGSNTSRGFSRPSLAIDCSDGPDRGRVYAAWEAGVNFLADPLGTLPGVAESEPNDAPGSADALTIGARATGVLATSTDADWYAFSGTAGQTVVVDLHPVNWNGGNASLHLYGGAGVTSDVVAYSRTNTASGSIVFTLPSTGTYWLLVLASSGTGLSYELDTGWHTTRPSDIGRDARDVVVQSSADGIGWDAARTIVNDDAPRYDNAMPEVAVDNTGRVHVLWYDHRDDAAQGRLTNVYRAFSDDGGATFSPNVKLNDGAASNYATQGSIYIHNLGAHAAIAADGCRVLAGFTDGRSGSPDVWTQVIHGTSVELSTTTLAQTADTTGLGSPVTFTATVAPWDAAGSVQFTDGGQPFGAPVPVDGPTGQALLVTSSLPVGTHEIGASFSGSGCLTASGATPVTHVVLPDNSFFSLDVTVVGSGTVTRDPDEPIYATGTVVQVTATPTPGWSFGGWSGDASGSANPVSVTMDADRSVTATFTELPVNTYTWSPTSTNYMGWAANWTPARSSPTTEDVLVFNGGQPTTVEGVLTQTFGRLLITNGTQVTFTAVTAGRVVTISGGVAPQLEVSAGSKLTLAGSNSITFALAAHATGTVQGALEATSASHKVVALGADALVFGGGAVVTAGIGFSSNLFGNGTGPSGLNSVAFESGSLYVQVAGATPFGANVPDAVVTFRPGSRYRLDGPMTPSFAGRTYADFEHNNLGTTTASGSIPYTFDSLIVKRGTLNLTTSASTTVTGDLRVNAGATLNVAPASGTPTVTLAGESPQHLAAYGTIASSPSVTWQIANPAGLTLLTDWTPPSALVFAGGRIATGSHLLTLPESLPPTGGSQATGWVDGKLARSFPAGTATRSFEVGDATTFAPVDVTVRGAAGPGSLRVSTAGGDHPAIASSELAVDRTANRSWTIAAGTLPSFTDADATFHFAASDLDPAAAPASFLVRRWNGTAWFTEPVGTRTPTSTQATGFTSLGDFAVGEGPGLSVDDGPLSPNGPAFAIAGITPNPAAGRSLVTLEMRRAADVRLTLLDLQGRVTATLVDGELPPGRHRFEWTAPGLPSGLYFLSFEAPDTRIRRRVVLAR